MCDLVRVRACIRAGLVTRGGLQPHARARAAAHGAHAPESAHAARDVEVPVHAGLVCQVGLLVEEVHDHLDGVLEDAALEAVLAASD